MVNNILYTWFIHINDCTVTPYYIIQTIGDGSDKPENILKESGIFDTRINCKSFFQISVLSEWKLMYAKHLY